MSDQLDGDGRTFDKLYGHYYPQAFKLARYRTRSHDDAEVIANDIMFRLWRYLESLNNAENPRAYFLSVVASAIADFRRKHKRSPDWEDFLQNVESKESQHIEYRETAQPPRPQLDWAYWCTLMQPSFSPALRELVAAANEAGWDNLPEIARRLAKSEHVVRSSMSRLRNSLLATLGWSDWMRTHHAYGYRELGYDIIARSGPGKLIHSNTLARFEFWYDIGHRLHKHHHELCATWRSSSTEDANLQVICMVRELAVDANQNFLREMFAEQSVPEEEWWIKIEINEVPPTPESDLGDGLRDHLKRIHTKILQGTQEFRASLRAFEERGLIRRGKEPGTYCILSFCS